MSLILSQHYFLISIPFNKNNSFPGVTPVAFKNNADSMFYLCTFFYIGFTFEKQFKRTIYKPVIGYNPSAVFPHKYLHDSNTLVSFPI